MFFLPDKLCAAIWEKMLHREGAVLSQPNIILFRLLTVGDFKIRF